MDEKNHNKNVIEVCKNSINYVRLRHDYLSKDNQLGEYKAISEEFREWLKKGYPTENIIYPVSYTHLTLPTSH